MFNEELENIISVLEGVNPISYGSCTIASELFEDSLDDGGVQRTWTIECISPFDWNRETLYGVYITISVDIGCDGILSVDVEGMEINGHLISDEHKKNIKGLFEERLHLLKPNTTQYLEEVMWTLVKFIERGTGS